MGLKGGDASALRTSIGYSWRGVVASGHFRQGQGNFLE